MAFATFDAHALPETWAFSPAALLCPPLVAFVPEEPFATHRPAKGGWVGGRS